MSKFHSLSYARKLKDAGVQEPQATIVAEGFQEILETIESDFASKEYLELLEQHLNNRIDLLDMEINTIKTILTDKIDNVESMLKWSIAIIGVGFFLALLNFIPVHC